MGAQGNLSLAISNQGSANLILYSLTSNNSVFTTNFNPADSLIVPGDTLLVTITFTPTQITAYSGTLTILSNDNPTTTSLQGTGIGPINVTLTPVNPPIVIPRTGGSFDFVITLQNLTSTPYTFDFWTEIIMPGVGSLPLMNVLGLTIPGGGTVNRNRTQQVPGSARSGLYYYYGYVGTYPWLVDDYSSFTFVKEGSDIDGSLGSPSDWLGTGEGFEEWQTQTQVEIPTEFALCGVFPNPFNPTTTISFALPEAAQVSLTVYDVSGRQVVELVNGWREAGTHDAVFDGSGLASGIYVYTLSAGDFRANGKMVLMK